MALEDFFTLTELKVGLTSPDRVKELISVIRKEKVCAANNVGDASRQWSTVANIIAITESKDCLDLFVQSDGLRFIGEWLNDALKFGTDSGDIFVEELTTALLRALDRLLIDNRWLVSSGIGTTVPSLLDHDNSIVRDKAKALWDKWMKVQVTEAPHDDETNSSIAISISSSCRNTNVEQNAEGSLDDMKPSLTVQQVDKEKKTINQVPLDPGDPPTILKSVGGYIPVKCETNEPKSEGTTLTGTSSSQPALQSDDSRLDKCVVDAKEKHEIDSLGKAGGMEASPPDVNNVMESAKDTGDKDEDMEDISAGSLQDSLGPGPSPKATSDGAEDETLVSDHKCHITTSPVSEVAQESEANTERVFCGFDLNQEVCSEETDHPMGSGLIPILGISVSRVVVADTSPVVSLQFEGTLGWKGSAAKSALQQIPECSFSGTPSNSKQRSDCLDIDLNIAEDNDDNIEDYSSQKDKKPIINGLPSVEESSVEASESRSARLHLDLNSLGDGSVDNVLQCQSPSQSSSSSSKQVSMRNIDLNLNNQLFISNDTLPDHQNLSKLLNHSTSYQGVHNQVESSFSLFGTQINLNPQDIVPSSNGRIMEPEIDLKLEKCKYGVYNDSPSGPSMLFPSPYGPLGAPIPYMVDPRGIPVPVTPQFMGFRSAQMGAGSNGNYQHGSWSVGGKRQEPESGWDGFPGNYKHQWPPWI